MRETIKSLIDHIKRKQKKVKRIAKPLIGYMDTTPKQLITFMELLDQKRKASDKYVFRTDGSNCEVALDYTVKGNLVGYLIYHDYEQHPVVYNNCAEGRKSLSDLQDVYWVRYEAYTLNEWGDGLEFVGQAKYLPLNQDEAYIDGVRVESNFQRSGVGSALIRTILKDLHKAGIKYVELDSVDKKDELKKNPSRISIPNQFYYSLGFENRIVEQDNLFLPRYLKAYTSPMLKKIYPEEEYPKRLACPLHAFMGKKRYYQFVCGLSKDDINEKY